MKYILHSGHITSNVDGQRHYISFGMLVRLYKLRGNEYDFYDSRFPDSYKDHIHLYPREDGNYNLPGRY